VIPDPREKPTVSVEEGGRIFGLGRSKAYEEANRFLQTDGAEGLPAVRFGRSIRVPTARLLSMIGLEPGDGDG
jgi:hypothetical protein